MVRLERENKREYILFIAYRYVILTDMGLHEAEQRRRNTTIPK